MTKVGSGMTKVGSGMTKVGSGMAKVGSGTGIKVLSCKPMEAEKSLYIIYQLYFSAMQGYWSRDGSGPYLAEPEIFHRILPCHCKTQLPVQKILKLNLISDEIWVKRKIFTALLAGRIQIWILLIKFWFAGFGSGQI
jgi:hypothetical protein